MLTVRPSALALVLLFAGMTALHADPIKLRGHTFQFPTLQGEVVGTYLIAGGDYGAHGGLSIQVHIQYEDMRTLNTYALPRGAYYDENLKEAFYQDADFRTYSLGVGPQEEPGYVTPIELKAGVQIVVEDLDDGVFLTIPTDKSADLTPARRERFEALSRR